MHAFQSESSEVLPASLDAAGSDTQALLDLAQAGDAEAFGELCRSYEAPLLRQALTLCGNLALAEDLAEDSLVEAWRCVRRYNGRCQFFTWLCAILLNRYRNTLREKRPFPFSTLSRDHQDEIQNRITDSPNREPAPDETVQLRERAEQVRKCIAALPAKHQQVIYLRFYVDDSLEGIAAALGCSVGTVKSRLFHALEKLRSMNALNTNSANRQNLIAL